MNKKDQHAYMNNRLKDFTEDQGYTLIGQLHNKNTSDSVFKYIFEQDDTRYITMLTMEDHGNHFTDDMGVLSRPHHDAIRIEEVENHIDDEKIMYDDLGEPLEQPRIKRKVSRRLQAQVAYAKALLRRLGTYTERETFDKLKKRSRELSDIKSDLPNYMLLNFLALVWLGVSTHQFYQSAHGPGVIFAVLSGGILIANLVKLWKYNNN